MLKLQEKPKVKVKEKECLKSVIENFLELLYRIVGAKDEQSRLKYWRELPGAKKYCGMSSAIELQGREREFLLSLGIKAT